MSGPPAWLWWAIVASLTTVPVCLIVAIVSVLLDHCTDAGARASRTATEATHTERNRT